jgi:hypothetical protein
MWAGVFAVGFVAVLGIALQARSAPSPRSSVIGLLEIGVSCAVAAATLIATYPNLYAHPFKALPRSTESSSSFVNGATENRLYVPKNVLTEIPTLLLVFILTGIVLGVAGVWRSWRQDPVRSARITMVGVQTLALPVVAIVMGSDLYHGLRQLLFATPTAGVLAAYGIAWVVHQRRWVVFAAAAALLLPTIDQVTLYPYETTYANLASDVVTAPFAHGNDRLGSDYWLASLPELIGHQTLDRQLLCKAIVPRATNIAYRFIDVRSVGSVSRSLDCREEPNGPLKPQDRPFVLKGPPTEFYAVFEHGVPRNCTPINRVTRWRHGFRTQLTVLARCTTQVPPLGAKRVSIHSPVFGFTLAGDLWPYLVDGWWQFPRDSALSSPVRSAIIAFRPVGCATGCAVEVQAVAPADVRARIGGAPVRVTHGRFAVTVPISAAQAADPDGVFVTFSRQSGRPLDMRVSALRLTEVS